MENAKYNTHQVRDVCAKKLKLDFSGKKEQSAWYSVDGRNAVRLTIPHGRKPVRRGVYRSMAGQLKLHHIEFDRLLDCTLDREQYDVLLRQKIQGG
jgi:hypothetical protein